nr:DUF805 domain-containing protein [Oscillospiraceae bacterium]
MYCKTCGKELPEGTRYCAHCGAAQSSGDTYNTYNTYNYNRSPEPKPPVGFVEAVKLYFQNYANFSGRSRRSEYWYACLFTFLLSLVVSMVIPDLAFIVSLATLVPSIAICVRRLHDIGKAGVWYLICFIPLVGGIILLVWTCKDSGPDNQWGPNPKY